MDHTFEWNRMFITNNADMEFKMWGFFLLFLESNKKSNAGLLKQMQWCLRNNSFFLFGLKYLFMIFCVLEPAQNILAHITAWAST